MNLIKKIFFYFLIVNIFGINIRCDELDDLIAKATDEMDASKPIVYVKRQATSIDVLSQIMALKINAFLANDLYRKTHTVIKRPINSLPIFNLYHTNHICQDWYFGISLFGNITDRAFYTGDSPFIDSYLDLTQKELQGIINDFAPPEALDALELARFTKKQERRSGLMFQVLSNYNNFSFEFDIPFFYEERNYFFTPEETEDLEDLSGAKTEKEQEKILKKHAVSDKIGFGDGRLKIGYSVFKNDRVCTKIGLQSTLPVAFSIKNGIIGSDFMKRTKKPRPSFSFQQVINWKDNDQKQLEEFLKEFGLQAVDWLSAMVLDAPLGNNRHLGLGFFIEPNIRINEGVTFKALSYIEYFLPGNERRFFLKVKNPKDFTDATINRETNNLTNEAAATEVVNFLNQEVIETLFPPVYEANVTPGFIFQLSVGPQFKLREWDLLFGYDFWYQHAEQINSIDSCGERLKTRKGLKNRAYTNKLFGRISFNRIEKNHDWLIVLNFEETLTSKGIGKDFSGSLGFEINF